MPKDARPATLISASAVGYYGDRRDEILREDSNPGDARQDFLARICTDWENEVFGRPIEGVRAVAVRLGVVFARGGGALETMLPAFNLGAGAVIGSGDQWMSWIHIDDALEALYFLLENSSAQGAANLTSPNPVTNREFTRALAGALSRPARFRVPSFGLKLAFGEKSSMLLASQRAIPARLQSLGFQFRYERIGEALGDLCSANRFESVQWIRRDVTEVFPFFSDAKNLERITPPWLSFHLLGSIDMEMREGTHIQYRLKLHGLPVKWKSRIDRWESGKMFRDIQVEGPYRRWEHEHRFISVGGGTLIKDSVRYKLPFGAFGEALAGHWVARDVRAIFAYRRKAIEEIFGKA
jgi:ligand-binding SRPBCC domain-containing protein